MRTLENMQLPDRLKRGDRLTWDGGPVCTVVSIHNRRRDEYGQPYYTLHCGRWVDAAGWARPAQDSKQRTRDQLQEQGYTFVGGAE
jgi:hypothetical protein